MQMIVSEAIKRIGFVVIRCYVGYADQEKAFRTKASPFHFPKSEHNKKPSMAIDFIPNPWNGDWNNLAPFADVAHVLIAVAEELYAAGKIKHKFRWGHDWDMDGIEGEKGEWDTDHGELVVVKKEGNDE
jgi:peptidoglycan L-alanyl-D-glutamate endopeptidase CwlK